MKTFSAKEKSPPPVRLTQAQRQSAFYPDGPQQATIVRQILRRPQLQTMLTVSAPNDRCEQEADRVADAVMRMPDETLSRQPLEEEEEELQTKLAGQAEGGPDLLRQVEEEEEEELIQPKRASGETLAVTPDLEQQIAQSRGIGQPLPESSRAFFEPRMGLDLAAVQVHSGAQAADLTERVNARAFTLGANIYFAAGEFAPESFEGKKLLAHELAHVAQQGANDQVQSKIYRQPGSQRGRSQPALIGASLNSRAAVIDQSKGVDQITDQFYHIPLSLLPPNSLIPAGPVLTLGPHGCGLRRYGLTTPSFDLSFLPAPEDIRVQSRRRAWNMGTGSNLHTVECWTNRAQFRLRLRQIIHIPNDLATHPCLEGLDPAQERQAIMDHERLHESDNVRAAEEVRDELGNQLNTTFGVGRMFALVGISDDPDNYIEGCRGKIADNLEKLRKAHDILFHRKSAEYASVRDPHDRELHNLKQRLLEGARQRQEAD